MKTYLRELFGPFWERGQFLALLQAVSATYLILQTASIARAFEELSAWWIALQSFGLVILLWAFVCLIRAPLLANKEEAELGEWHGSRFVYRQPKLVATFRCKATGQPQWHRLVIDDAEPNAFVYFTIEMEGTPPTHLFSATLVGTVVLKGYDTEPGHGARSGGIAIGPKRDAHLLIVMQEEMISQTARVFIRDFSLGSPEDQDGSEGEFREAFRRHS